MPKPIRLLFTFFLLLLPVACAQPPAPAPEAPPEPPRIGDVLSSAFEHTVVIRSSNSVCTGVRISKSTIITAAHCLSDYPDATPMYVEFKDRFDWVFKTTTIQGVDWDVDVAALTPDDQAYDLPDVAIAPVAVGEFVFTVGHGNLKWWTPTQGFVLSLEPPTETDLHDDIVTNVEIHPGNSGGGLWAADGSLVGVCSRLYGFLGIFSALKAIPAGDSNGNTGIDSGDRPAPEESH